MRARESFKLEKTDRQYRVPVKSYRRQYNSDHSKRFIAQYVRKICRVENVRAYQSYKLQKTARRYLVPVNVI